MLPLLLQVPKPYVGVFVPWCKRAELGNWCLKSAQGIQGQVPPSEIGRSLKGLVHLLWRPLCCGPGKKNALYPSEHSDTPVLVPTSPEGCVIRCLSYNSRFPAATGLFIPWYSRELMLVPGAGAWSCTVSSTLA